MSNGEVPYKEWIVMPALITLAVTLLRLIGELMQWNEVLFGTPTSGFAVIGATWLIPIFGIYFGHKLASNGYRPRSVGKAALWLLLAFVVSALIAGGVTALLGTGLLSGLGLVVAAAVGLWIAFKGWRDLACVLTAYAYAVRIPIVIIALLSILGEWGTHYEAAPAGYEQSNALLRWVEIALLPQLSMGVMMIVALGGLFACLGTLFARSSTPAEV
ncbi:MAG TPA: hypothetical protein VLU25_17900 [Acidobacteriota bacterium]|nr:hypothetical protein [Acidobacteriota bacterium]